MATDKRARQRANREQKQAEAAAAARKARLKQRLRQAGIWVIVGAVLFVLANAVWG